MRQSHPFPLAAGVIFIETNGEGPGVRLRKVESSADGPRVGNG